MRMDEKKLWIPSNMIISLSFVFTVESLSMKEKLVQRLGAVVD